MEKQPKAHDCRKNHGTLSKAMEPASGVELIVYQSFRQKCEVFGLPGDDDS